MKKISIRDLLLPFALFKSKRPASALIEVKSEKDKKQKELSAKSGWTFLVRNRTLKRSNFFFEDKVTLYSD